MSERLVFDAIERQREIVKAASRQTGRIHRKLPRKPAAPAGPWGPSASSPAAANEVDYSRPAEPYPVEIWEQPWPAAT